MNNEKKTVVAINFPAYTIKEEIINSILHGFGTLGAVFGLIMLILKTSGAKNIVSVVIFTATMVGMFLISTLYHAIQHTDAKRILRKFDHSAIFIFIAGTYTPFCLSALRGGWGWSIFTVEWFLALTGIILHAMNNKMFKKIETAVYILMGWVIVIGCVPLFRAVPIQSIIPLVIGGLFYTLGTIWYRRKNMKHSHAVWHIFVILGALFHWYSIWNFI